MSIPRIGTEVRLRKDYDAAHEFSVKAGATGVIEEIFSSRHQASHVQIKMDHHIPGAEPWENCILITEDVAPLEEMFFDFFELK